METIYDGLMSTSKVLVYGEESIIIRRLEVENKRLKEEKRFLMNLTQLRSEDELLKLTGAKKI